MNYPIYTIMKKILLLFTFVICCSQISHSQHTPFLPNEKNAECEQWVNNTISRMGIKEQIDQLLLYTVDPVDVNKTKKTLAKTFKKNVPGGILFTQGTAGEQAELTNYIQSVSVVPVLIAFEGEWGVGAQLKNMPDFPKNAALGCIEDNSLIETYGREVARELRELGVHINFAPVADINNNPENPSINVRSFGSRTHNVTEKVLAYSKGLESGNILPVLKHFPGQGDTKANSDMIMPTIPFSRSHLDSVELYPYKEAIQAGVGGIMVGHLRYPAIESDRSTGASFSSSVINGLLKTELGFKGLVLSEPLYKSNVYDIPEIEVKALKAGNDMIVVNGDLEKLQKEIMQAVKNGDITTKEIEEKCRKVLTYKFLLGLKNKPKSISINRLEARINTPEAQELAARLRAESVTVLGNYGNVLPLTATSGSIAVVSVGGKDKDNNFLSNLSKYANHTIFRVTLETDKDELKRINNELTNFRRIVVTVATDELESRKYVDFLSSIPTQAPIVYVFFSPYRELLPIKEPLSKASAVILAHSAQDDLQKQVADVMFGKATARGRLSMSIGKLFRAGSGITITPETVPGYVPEDYGMKSYILHQGIDSIVHTRLRNGAFPGCQILILKDGKPVYTKAFGVHSDKDKSPVQPTDLFDIGGLTKTTGTLLAIMKLYDTGKLKLTDKVSQYVPALRSGNKRDITIKELLFHESGMAPNIRFHRETIDDHSVEGPFTQDWKDEHHQTRMGEFTWVCSDFRFKRGIMSTTQTATHKLHVADGMWLINSFKNTMMQVINNSPMDNKRYVYSPTGFILLQQVIENITKKPLDEYLESEFYTPMGLTRTKFLPLRYFTKSEIMPTASNDYFRRQDMCGYVLDELAACQGGISGNAGLFSTAHEVAQIHQMLLNGGELNGKRYISEATCKLFTTEKSAISRRGLGFDKPALFDPAAPLANPCSPSTPLEAYGLRASTGSCAWVDPVNNLVYVFLSNRNCPDLWNDEIILTRTLQHIQEFIYKSID